ncbi:MAG TPA: LON peptidase substrate-binding domain-containing protein [Gemmatimonadales bacterium]
MKLPLFPLDVVLFPGALLPLHIFEPRYQQMLGDCLAGDRRFGLLPSGGEERPATGLIGTVAEIRATQPLPDGRANIVVSGERRFMLRRYLEDPAPYYVGLVDPFDDEQEEVEAADEHTKDLRRLADRCAEALRQLTDTPAPANWAADAATLSFQVAAMLEVDREFKRRFLGMRSAVHRVVLLLELLPTIVSDLEARGAVRTRASGNGTGGAHPDIAVQP